MSQGDVQAVASGIRVLVIERSSLVRRAVRHTLETLGAHVTEAFEFDGADASGAELILCGLPRGGFEAIVSWHTSGEHSATVVPLVFEFEAVPDGLPDAFTTPLIRPFTPHALSTTIAGLVPDLVRLEALPFPEPISHDELELEIDIDPIVSASQIPARRGKDAESEPQPVLSRADPAFSDDDWDLEPLSGQRPSLTDSIFDEQPGHVGVGLPVGESLETFPVMRPEIVGEEDDLDIVEVAAIDPLPEWASILIDVWPVMAREGVREARGRLLATALAVSGMPAPAHWTRPEVAEAAAERVELLSRTRAIHGDLAACPALELFASVRRRNLNVDLYVETERAQWRMRIDGDRLLEISPASTQRPRLLAELLVDLGHVARERLERFLVQGGGDGELGPALVHAGLVTAEQLADAVREQTRGYVADVCAADEGYHVVRLRGPAEDTHGPSLSVMLLELLRRGAIRTRSPLAASDRIAVDPVTYDCIEGSLDPAERVLMQSCGRPVAVGDVAADLGVALRLHALGALHVLHG